MDFSKSYNPSVGMSLLNTSNTYPVKDDEGNVIDMVSGKRKAFLGGSPTLTIINLTYGSSAAASWLCIQLEDVNTFCGGTLPMTKEQMFDLAQIIVSLYHYYKASELLYFFARFKSGVYGEIYGSLKPTDITSALLKFKSERSRELCQFQNEDLKKKLGI